MLKIDRYIMQSFLLGIFPALLLLVALFSFMALAEELENVGQGSYRLPDALWVIFLTTPKRIVELLPVTSLLGGLFGLGAMANNRELIAMRTIGVSKQRIAKTVAVLAMFLCVFITLLQFYVVPGFEHEAAVLRGQAAKIQELNSGESAALWTRRNEHFIRVDDVENDRTLSNIEIYSTDPEGRLTSMVEASKALLVENDQWLLRDVLESRYEEGRVLETRYEQMNWNGLLSAEEAAVMILPLEALAPDNLVRSITMRKQNNLDTHLYQVVLWQQVSLLPSLMAMALLSLPFLLGSVRSVSASQRTMIGGLIGISFYLLQQLSGHMAGILGLNPALIILTPPLVLLMIAIAAIRHKTV